MQKKLSVRVFAVLMTVFMLAFSIPIINVSAATVYTENKTGMDGTYDFELWKDRGNTTMTLNGNGKFSCEWNNINNCLFREGKKYNPPVNYKSLGDVEIKYGVDYQPNGNSYMCVYGWSKNPLVEYYIVETWGSWRPPGQAENKGTVTVNGGTYDIYKTTRYNAPSIEGDTTFDQYWSVRKDKPKANGTKIEGIISVSDHFKAWERAGLPALGNLTEIALNIEGYQSSGKANVYENILKIGGRFDGSETPTTVDEKPAEPDSNGYYYNDTFESGAGKWTSRGSAKLDISSSAKHAGSKSMSVTGRTDSWNGACMDLDTTTFKPGESFSFSTYMMQDSVASDNFKLSLEYTLDGKANYDTIAEATGSKGKWVQLANPSYKIPAGASGLILYVETDTSTNSFYFDDAIVAKNGTKVANDSQSSDPEPTPSTGGSTATLAGDVDGSGSVNANDVKALTSFLSKRTKTITLANADVNGDGKINIFDLVALKKMLSKGTSSQGQTQQPSSGSSSGTTDPKTYMANVSKTLTLNVPGNITAQTNDQISEVTYFSKKANKNKKALVWTPAGYSTNKKYPVVYVNHGIGGSANDMRGVVPIASNLIKAGEAEEMIVVLTNMYTNPYKDNSAGINAEETKYYDDFLDDISESLMPYIESKYSVKTGRENTAITGFSMGGRESLYIGISRPDLFGYIGAAAPAPGIVPAQDMFMTHPGNMSESEFKVKDSKNQPYLILIAGGTNDGVVGTFPEQYHNLFTKNGQDHLWMSVPGGGHDDSVIKPLMYNFFRNIFKTGSQSSSSGTVTPSTGNTTTGSTAGFFKSTFESGTDGWTSRGNTTLATDSGNYYSGSKSLKVTGRGDTWQGAAYDLDTSTFVPGNAYSFSTAVMQTSSATVEMKLTLQYTLGGEDNYATIAKADAASCKWTKLENTAYTIPSGATNLILYVESTSSTTDYYIDEAVAAAKGTASAVTTGGGKVSATPTAATSSNGSVDTSWIDKSKPMVAIAFDDGPDPGHNYAGRILDAISNSGFHATFFYWGSKIANGGANEIKKADSLGMEIANHTMNHKDLTTLSASEIRKEYDDCSNAVKSVIGRGTAKVMRPPYLSVNNTVKQALSDIALVNCKIDTGDWSGASKDQIINKITSAMNDGSLKNAVILCHETYESTAAAMEYLAPYLKSKGWQIVTVSEMFAANGKQLKTGDINNYC